MSRPFLQHWLRRTRRQLGASGQLRQVATVLSQREGGDADHHAQRLRAILAGEVSPSPDELIAIDLVLARPQNAPAAPLDPPPLL